MIAENPVRGVYTKAPGEIYTQWDQPYWLQKRYNSLINDYLLIGYEYVEIFV